MSRLTPAAALLLASAGFACHPSNGAVTTPGPDRIASGYCLGGVCLDTPEDEARAALGASGPAGRCYRLDDGITLSFEVDAADARRPVRAILVTTLAHCSADGGGEPMALASGGPIADCRGLRPGDPESFAAKVHRQATPFTPGSDPWSGAPDGVRGVQDSCDAAAAGGGPRAGVYLSEGRVVGLAVWRP